MICLQEFPRHAGVVDEFRETKDQADSYFGQLAGHCRVRSATLTEHSPIYQHLIGGTAHNLTGIVPGHVLVVK